MNSNIISHSIDKTMKEKKDATPIRCQYHKGLLKFHIFPNSVWFVVVVFVSLVAIYYSVEEACQRTDEAQKNRTSK